MKFTRTIKTACEVTIEVSTVAAMFGIGADREHEIVLYRDLELSPAPGRVILLTGESGAGKSSLLRDIRDADHGMAVVAVPVPEERPLVNLFDSLEQALRLLSFAGICEVAIWLRKPGELSDGQRYRLSIALALWAAMKCDRPAMVCLDEFLATLDREAAKAVAHQIRKVADQFNVCFVVATTHADLTEDLDPDEIVKMRLGVQPTQHGGRGDGRVEKVEPGRDRSRSSKARAGHGGVPAGGGKAPAKGPKKVRQAAAQNRNAPRVAPE